MIDLNCLKCAKEMKSNEFQANLIFSIIIWVNSINTVAINFQCRHESYLFDWFYKFYTNNTMLCVCVYCVRGSFFFFFIHIIGMIQQVWNKCHKLLTVLRVWSWKTIQHQLQRFRFLLHFFTLFYTIFFALNSNRIELWFGRFSL